MQKKFYMQPEMKVVEIDSGDIICTSPDPSPESLIELRSNLLCSMYPVLGQAKRQSRATDRLFELFHLGL